MGKKVITTEQVPPPDIDILEDVEDRTVSALDLQQAVRYAHEMDDIATTLAELAAKSDELSNRFNKIQLELLPDLLLAIGIKKLSLENGELIEVKDFVRGTIPTLQQIEKADELDRDALEERRVKALAWLKSVGADSIIKNSVIVEFAKGQDKDAIKLFAKIQAEGFKVKKEEEINFQTLNAYLKVEIEAGKAIPVEPFALFVGKKATIKKSKQPKEGK